MATLGASFLEKLLAGIGVTQLSQGTSREGQDI